MRKMYGRSFETKIEFLHRIQYGAQLTALIKLRGADRTELAKTTSKGLWRILTNDTTPNSINEKKLMRELGFIPMLSAVHLESNELDTVGTFTMYQLLSNLLLRHGYSAKSFQEEIVEKGGVMASTVYDILRGNRVQYHSMNTLLSYLGYQLTVALVPATQDLMQSFIQSLNTVARDTGLYESGTELLTSMPEDSFYFFGAADSDSKYTAKKEFGPADISAALRPIQFRFKKGVWLSESLQAYLAELSPYLRNQFLSNSLSSTELLLHLVGKRFSFIVTLDPNMESRAANRAHKRTCYTIRDLIQFIGVATWGDVWLESLPVNIRKVYEGERQLRLAGLCQFLQWYNATVIFGVTDR